MLEWPLGHVLGWGKRLKCITDQIEHLRNSCWAKSKGGGGVGVSVYFGTMSSFVLFFRENKTTFHVNCLLGR